MKSKKMIMSLGLALAAVPAFASCGKTQEPVHEHTYSETGTWTWNDQNEATLSFECTECDDVYSIEGNVQSVTTDATCVDDKYVTYTATATYGGQEYTDVKTVTEEGTATGIHTYEGQDCSVCHHFNEDCLVHSVIATQADWAKSDFYPGNFQYGGQDGTTCKLVQGMDAAKSKEIDGSVYKASIDGDGDTTDRIYSTYFKLKKQKEAIGLVNPTAVSFWVYNEVECGGLCFKADGSETYNVKTYDENGDYVGTERNLNYTGFRRYVVQLTAEQFNATELEIGIWGAYNDTVVNYSGFAFIDSGVEEVSLGNTSALNFTNFGDGVTMTKSVVDAAGKTVDADGKALKVTRESTGSNKTANIYLQMGNNGSTLFNGKNPSVFTFTIYNQTKIVDYAKNGVAFKLNNASAINVYQSLDFQGFKTFSFPIGENDLNGKSEIQIQFWGEEAGEFYLSGFHYINVLPAE